MERERRKRRKFTSEYKAEVVRLAQTSGKSLTKIAEELDLTETAVRAWVKRAAQKPASAGGALSADERAELAQLRKEVRELRMEREILKKATAFFAKHGS